MSTCTGTLVGLGGTAPVVDVNLLHEDGEMECFLATRSMAKQMRYFLFQKIQVDLELGMRENDVALVIDFREIRKESQ